MSSTEVGARPRRRPQALVHQPLSRDRLLGTPVARARGGRRLLRGQVEDEMKRLFIVGLLAMGAAGATPASADWRVAIGVSQDRGAGPRSATDTTGAGARARRRGTATDGAGATRASGAKASFGTATAGTRGGWARAGSTPRDSARATRRATGAPSPPRGPAGTTEAMTASGIPTTTAAVRQRLRETTTLRLYGNPGVGYDGVPALHEPCELASPRAVDRSSAVESRLG